MAKTRQQSDKNNTITAKKGTKVTPPGKKIGKVGKIRVNIKKLTNSNEGNLNINCNAEKNKECESNEIVENSSLQENCTGKNDILRRSKRISVENNTNVKTKNLLKNNQISIKSGNRTSDQNMAKSDQKANNSKEVQNLFSKKQLQSQIESVVQTRSSAVNQLPNKECFIKLPKIRNKNTPVDIRTAASPPDLTKIANAHQTGSKSTKCGIPISTKNCVVRLKRNAKMDSLPANQCPNIPATDNSCRNYFRKLSLTKSFNKLVDNETPEKNKLSGFEKENQYVDKSKNNTEISESIQALNEDNPSCTQKHKQTAIKQISKLSLRRRQNTGTSKEMSNKLHVEPQLEGSLLFNPKRNSTLLDLDLTVSNELKKSNEETKQILSSKGRSSYENLANKPTEIVNLINSLDDVVDIRSSSLSKIMDSTVSNSLKKSNNETKQNSSSKGRSSYENLANKSIEIENLLSSLDDDEEIIHSTINKQLRKSNEETKQTSVSKGRMSSENLANKSVENENLLSLLDDEKECRLSSLGQTKGNDSRITKSNSVEKNEAQNNSISKINKTNKFFHHKNENSTVKILKDNSTKAVATKKRRFKTKRSTNVNHDNVYEFFSQSQTSDSDTTKHVDPTAEVVKRLIKEGKVQLATNCRGKGKPKFKPRKRSVKLKKNIIQTNVKKLNQLKNKKKKVTFIENENAENNEDHFEMDNFQNDNFDDDDGEHLSDEGEKNISNLNANNSKNAVSEQEGTFSRLARSVLINQAERTDTQRNTQKELLKAVRNIISTPINKKSNFLHNALQSDLSPIVMASPRQPKQAASPWRVNDDSFLPKTFNFNRSSGNLPSFSSDYIPCTPRKQKSNTYQNTAEPTITTCEKSSTKRTTDPSVIQNPLADSIENVRPQVPNLNEISSFSSNDSNAENMPPAKQTPENQNENERIFDSKQLPNPRRALKCRTPLKAINILEVVHLPNYKHPSKSVNSDDIGVKQLEMFGFEENLSLISNASLNTKQQTDSSMNSNSQTKDDLFGFEDYLSQTEVSSQENAEVCSDRTANEQNQTIHDKLQCLRKLKPLENEVQNHVKQNAEYPPEDIQIFSDVDSRIDGKKQRNIKEMFCSTLLDTRPSTSKEALKRLNNNKLTTNTKRPIFGEDINLSELFMDPEPTSFNENDGHRTYIRPKKRKRRLKENNFVLILESDESEDEDNSAEKRQLSRESHNSSDEIAAKKKRKRKEPKEDVALTEFVKEFNELCKEVESHELVVEKSA